MFKYKYQRACNMGLSNSGNFVSMRTGSKLIETLSNSLYSNVYYVFDELVSNAYDADATIVKIQIADDKDTIEDNGDGMDRSGVENFFDLGFSNKADNRTTRKFGRRTIGKFGIGKLTMAVIASHCTLETQKGDMKTTAILDFQKILKERYLHEAKIPIKEEKSRGDAGTKITLVGLKKEISITKLKRRLMESMPLNPTFSIILNGVELKAEHSVIGERYPIVLNSPLMGNIKGELTLADKNIGEYAGIYMRVNGRIVNADNSNWLNSAMMSFTSAMSFINRIYCIIDADALDECILANRNDFKEDHPKFIEFKDLLLKELRKINKQSQEDTNTATLNFERQIAKEVVEKQINKMVEHVDMPDDWMVQYSKRKDAEKIRGVIQKIKRRQSDPVQPKESKEPDSKRGPQNPNKVKFEFDDRIIRIGKKRFRFKLDTAMGKDDPECVFDNEEGVIYINTNHPQYIVSRAEDSLYCHFRKAIAFEIANTLSQGVYAELVDKYQGMMHADIDVIDK